MAEQPSRQQEDLAKRLKEETDQSIRRVRAELEILKSRIVALLMGEENPGRPEKPKAHS